MSAKTLLTGEILPIEENNYGLFTERERKRVHFILEDGTKLTTSIMPSAVSNYGNEHYRVEGYTTIDKISHKPIGVILLLDVSATEKIGLIELKLAQSA